MDRFCEHLPDVEKNERDPSKPVARHFNLPIYKHFHHNMANCDLSLHHGNRESRKNLEQKFIFQIGTLYPHASHPINLFTNSSHHISTNGKAPSHPHKTNNNPQFLYSLWSRDNARNVSVQNLSQWYFLYLYQLDKTAKFSFFALPPAQRHSFIRNLKFLKCSRGWTDRKVSMSMRA